MQRDAESGERKTQMQIDLEEDAQPIAKTDARGTLRHWQWTEEALPLFLCL